MSKGTRKGTHAAAAACLHYLAGKNILIDWENVKFWASRAGYFKKHQIIDGSACILHCSLLKTPHGWAHFTSPTNRMIAFDREEDDDHQ